LEEFSWARVRGFAVPWAFVDMWIVAMIHGSDTEGLFRIEAKEPIGVDTAAGKGIFMATKCMKSIFTPITGTTMASTRSMTTTAMIADATTIADTMMTVETGMDMTTDMTTVMDRTIMGTTMTTETDTTTVTAEV